MSVNAFRSRRNASLFPDRPPYGANQMMYSTKNADHLFVWHNDKLVYKRWVGGVSMIFDTYGPPRMLPKSEQRGRVEVPAANAAGK